MNNLQSNLSEMEGLKVFCTIWGLGEGAGSAIELIYSSLYNYALVTMLSVSTDTLSLTVWSQCKEHNMVRVALFRGPCVNLGSMSHNLQVCEMPTDSGHHATHRCYERVLLVAMEENTLVPPPGVDTANNMTVLARISNH